MEYVFVNSLPTSDNAAFITSHPFEYMDGKRSKYTNVWQVFISRKETSVNVNFIRYNTIRFSNDDLSLFSSFHGYSYPVLDGFHMELINPFIIHIFKIVCNQNIGIYKFIIALVNLKMAIPNSKIF